ADKLATLRETARVPRSGARLFSSSMRGGRAMVRSFNGNQGRTWIDPYWEYPDKANTALAVAGKGRTVPVPGCPGLEVPVRHRRARRGLFLRQVGDQRLRGQQEGSD